MLHDHKEGSVMCWKKGYGIHVYIREQSKYYGTHTSVCGEYFGHILCTLYKEQIVTKRLSEVDNFYMYVAGEVLFICQVNVRHAVTGL